MFCDGMDVGLLFENDVWDRRASGKSAADVFAQILARNPKEIHFGAAWSLAEGAAPAKTFVQRPFVVDIDLPDYRQSARGAGRETYTLFQTLHTPDRGPSDPAFRKSWRFVEIAVEIIDRTLAEDFGLTDRRWVSSGNKGVHCWVFDDRACKWDSSARGAVFKYMTSDEGLFKEAYASAPRHDARAVAGIKLSIFKRSAYLARCYQVIRTKMAAILDDQGLWDEATRQVLGEPPGSAAAAAKLRDARAVDWSHYEQADYMRAVEFALKVALPRLDAHAAHHGHMSKIPFSVHDKTGKLAVPFDPAKVAAFDPALAPMAADALAYHDAVARNARPGPGKNIAAYVRWFERGAVEDPPAKRACLGGGRRVPDGLKGLFKHQV